VSGGLGQQPDATLAIINDLEIIGEAAVKLTPEFKAAQTHIPWADIIGIHLDRE
jgi:uncharacterized protein with HEPN domain